MDAKLIDEYEQAGAKIRQAIAGLTAAQLNAVPVLGSWSIQQIVIHLMDDDLIWTDRMKRVIAEDNPSLIGFDQTRFASELHYELWPVDEALIIFQLNRKNFAKVLRKLPDSALERKGTHSETGVLRLGEMIPHIIHHVDHHLKFIHQKREMVLKSHS